MQIEKQSVAWVMLVMRARMTQIQENIAELSGWRSLTRVMHVVRLHQPKKPDIFLYLGHARAHDKGDAAQMPCACARCSCLLDLARPRPTRKLTESSFSCIWVMRARITMRCIECMHSAVRLFFHFVVHSRHAPL